MADYYDQLVKLYAKHRVDEIRENSLLIENEFGKSVSDLKDDWDFPGQKKLVQEIKRRIEKRKAELGTPTQKQRIGECLNIILQISAFGDDGDTEKQKKIEVAVGLLENMFSSDWSNDQEEHFRFAASLVDKWKTYFVSYTNAQPQALNAKYKKVIKRHVNRSTLDDRDWDKDNILVDAIVNILKTSNLKGYYDREQIKIGDNIKREIPPAARNAFSFVQIVQRESFTERNPNWSFDEFQHFRVHNKNVLKDHMIYKSVFGKRFKSVLTHKDKSTLVPDLIPFEYESWRDRILDEQHHKVLPTEPDEFRSTVDSLGTQIYALQKEFFESAPD